MNSNDVEEGKRLLALVGALRVVGQVTAPPNDGPNKIGSTIKNKAQGNISYGYFDDDDDEEEANAFNLIVWLLNNAKDMIACADVALSTAITIPELGTSEFDQLHPLYQAAMLRALSFVALTKGVTVKDIFASDQHRLDLIHQLKYVNIPAEQVQIIFNKSGYKF